MTNTADAKYPNKAKVIDDPTNCCKEPAIQDPMAIPMPSVNKAIAMVVVDNPGGDIS